MPTIETRTDDRTYLHPGNTSHSCTYGTLTVAAGVVQGRTSSADSTAGKKAGNTVPEMIKVIVG